jgi:hypothetical protein
VGGGKIRLAMLGPVKVQIPIFDLYILGIKIYNSGSYTTSDRLCGLVIRVSGCRPRGLGFDSRLYEIY